MGSQILSAFKILQYLFRQKNYGIKNTVHNFANAKNLAINPQIPSDQCRSLKNSWVFGFMGFFLWFSWWWWWWWVFCDILNDSNWPAQDQDSRASSSDCRNSERREIYYKCIQIYQGDFILSTFSPHDAGVTCRVHSSCVTADHRCSQANGTRNTDAEIKQRMELKN